MKVSISQIGMTAKIVEGEKLDPELTPRILQPLPHLTDEQNQERLKNLKQALGWLGDFPTND
jgi:hypothetical protein